MQQTSLARPTLLSNRLHTDLSFLSYIPLFYHAPQSRLPAQSFLAPISISWGLFGIGEGAFKYFISSMLPDCGGLSNGSF